MSKFSKATYVLVHRVAISFPAITNKAGR